MMDDEQRLFEVFKSFWDGLKTRWSISRPTLKALDGHGVTEDKKEAIRGILEKAKGIGHYKEGTLKDNPFKENELKKAIRKNKAMQKSLKDHSWFGWYVEGSPPNDERVGKLKIALDIIDAHIEEENRELEGFLNGLAGNQTNEIKEKYNETIARLREQIITILEANNPPIDRPAELADSLLKSNTINFRWRKAAPKA